MGSCLSLALRPVSSPPHPRLERVRDIRVLTWNTSDVQPSVSAPPGWGQRQQRDGIASVIIQQQPDLVLLQELQAMRHPDSAPGIPDLLTAAGYSAHGHAQSHCGHCTTFVREGSGLTVMGGAATVGPATLLSLETQEGCRVCVANCHLEPFKGGAAKRLKQLTAVTQAMDAWVGGVVIVAGDMNMRAAEDAGVRRLGLTDAWVLAGEKKDARWTVDTYRNQYFAQGFKYKARYDRIYLGGLRSGCSALQLVGDTAIANHPGLFLSDHFGVLATVSVL